MSWTHDTFGNRLTETQGVSPKVTMPTSSSATYNTNNQLATSTLSPNGNPKYDAAGDVNYDGANSYLYDAEGRIASAAGTAYTYDGAGERVAKPGKLYWRGTGSDALAETSATDTNPTRYIFFGGKRIARLDPGATTPKYYVSDNLGSTAVVTDSLGNVLSESEFYPYGGEQQVATGDTNTYKFTGKERDAESGNDYFGARYYASSMGRWMSPDWSAKEDPVPYATMDDPQSLNLYGYVRNNPLSRTDPDGHQDPCTCQAFSNVQLPTIQLPNSLPNAFIEAGLGLYSLATTGHMLNSSQINAIENPGTTTEQGRDAQGKFLPTTPGQTAPGANAEKETLAAEGATKTGTTLPGTNHKVDGTVTDTGQKVDVKSGGVVANTGQLQATGDAARAATGKPLLVPTTNPNVHVTGPAAANPNLEIRPAKKPQQ